MTLQVLVDGEVAGLHREAHGGWRVQISGGTTRETNLTLYGAVSSRYCSSGCLCCRVAACFKARREKKLWRLQ